jgi:P4 family phage/plasmid primase-like protien
MSTRNPFAGGSTAPGPARPEAGSGEKSASGSGEAQDVGISGGATASGYLSTGARLRIPPDPERDLTCCRLPLTDLGNAERWRVRFGRDFRFCAELGWLNWDGRRWRLLSEEKDKAPAAVIWSIAATVRAIRNEAALVAASGCGEMDEDEVGPRQRAAWRALTERVTDEGRDDYLSPLPDEADGPVTGWTAERAERRIAELDPLDFVIDLAKDKTYSSTILAWAKRSEASGAVGAIMGWVKGFPDIVVRTDQLDTDPLAINVLNGTLRLAQVRRKRTTADREAKVRAQVAGGGSADQVSVWHTPWDVVKEPHRREDLITKLAPVDYRPSAKCPAFDKFIDRVQPDPAMRRFLDQWGGYSLTGDTTEDKLAFFYGQGRNGKGTTVELLAHIAGDYAGTIDFSSLSENVGGKRRGDQATPDIADLPGVRFLRVSEPEKGAKLNDGLIKQFTGRDPVKARHLNKSFFVFFPDFKITISGNHKPNIRDLSHGMWARIQLVPWDVIIPDEEIDRGLPDHLLREASGVLNRLIAGLLDWRRNGLIVPEQVRAATQAYRDESDDVGRFLTALCEVGPKEGAHRIVVGAKALHDVYLAWAEHAGAWAMNNKNFKASLESKGFAQITSDGQKWPGLQLRAGVDLEQVKLGRWPAPPSAEGDGSAVSGMERSGADDPGGGSGVLRQAQDDREWGDDPASSSGAVGPYDDPPPGWESGP